MKTWVTIALLICGVSTVGIALAASGHSEDTAPAPSALDRRMAAEQLQSFSDFVGFEAHFEARGNVLVMTGGELCGPDVLGTLPGDMVPIMRAAGFARLDCAGARGERASVAVPR